MAGAPPWGCVFVATYGSGVFRSSQSTVAVERDHADMPMKFSLEQNYPNPFNPSTRIKFQISSPEVVTLKVFDALGRSVATLLNEQKLPGTYVVPLDVRSFDGSLPTGVYFYRLDAGEYSRTLKMTLVK